MISHFLQTIYKNIKIILKKHASNEKCFFMLLFQKENNVDKKQKMKKKKCIKNLKKNVEPQKIKVVRKYDTQVW